MKRISLIDQSSSDLKRYVKFKMDPGQAPREEEINFMDDTSQCPICFGKFPNSEILQHVDSCLESLEDNPQPLEMQNTNSVTPSKADQYDPVNKTSFRCPICYEEIPKGSGYIYQQCGHQYCGDCLNGYYTELITNGKVNEVKCPDPSCLIECTYEDIQFIVSQELLLKYVEFKRNAMVNADPEMRWCSNPAGCGNAFKRTDPTSLKMVCGQCNYQFCFDCKEEFHGTKSCEEFRVWKLASSRVDIRFYLWQKLNTKPCPSCKAPIQKHGGCNHMVCESCKFEFCWQCLKEYESGHYEDSWCTQYGKSAGLVYAKAIGLTLLSTALPFINFDSSSWDSSSDDETLGERLGEVGEALGEKMTSVKEEMGEKLTEVKEEMGEKISVVKEDLSEKIEETMVRIKSLWQK
uniref:RBR-type E3 ubiquitin transferase n=1 Tax=Arcella intermedia TaxID=1963864 RepID=A0A6B2L571_9EUKA